MAGQAETSETMDRQKMVLPIWGTIVPSQDGSITLFLGLATERLDEPKSDWKS